MERLKKLPGCLWLVAVALSCGTVAAQISLKESAQFFRAESAVVYGEKPNQFIEATSLQITPLFGQKVSVEIGTDDYRFWVFDQSATGFKLVPFITVSKNLYLIIGAPGQKFQVVVLPYDKSIKDQFIDVTIPGAPTKPPTTPPVPPPVTADFEKAISDGLAKVPSPDAGAKKLLAVSARSVVARKSEFATVEVMSRAWKDSNYAALGDQEFKKWSPFFSSARDALLVEHTKKPMDVPAFAEYLLRIADVLGK